MIRDRDLALAGVISLAGYLFARSVAKRRQAANVPAGESPVGDVSLGPLEPVTGPGSSGPTLPPAGEIPGLDIVLAEPGSRLCRCAPIGSFGEACRGQTWIELGYGSRVDLRGSTLPKDCN